MKKKEIHNHKYKRITYPSGHTIYRCVLVGCPHFINAALLPGRMAVCWRCNSVFIIKNTVLVKPHCDDCTKKDEKKTKVKSIVNDINIDKLTDLLTGTGD